MGTLAGTTLVMCLKPQQTAEMNFPHFLIVLDEYVVLTTPDRVYLQGTVAWYMTLG